MWEQPLATRINRLLWLLAQVIDLWTEEAGGGGGCMIKGSLPSRVGEARRSHAGTAADRDGQVAPPCCPPSGHQRRVGDRRPIAESRGFRRRQGGNKELCPEVLGALLRSLAAFPRLRSLVNTLMATEGGRWAESWRYGSKATTG